MTPARPSCCRLFLPVLLLALLAGGCAGETTVPDAAVPGAGAPVEAAVEANADDAPIASDAVARQTLVDVRSVDETLRVEARYATDDNFTGEPLPGYEGDAQTVLLHRDAAEALGRVQAGLREQGLGLLVWDGYRPVRATEAMVEWAARTGRTGLLDEGYIARRSRHNMGVAVDLTLIRLDTGQPLDMGTPYDTFSADSHTANAQGQVLENRMKLVEAMEAQGFTNYVKEWWHFSYPVADALPFNLPIE